MASFPSLAEVLGNIDARLAAAMAGPAPIRQRPGPAPAKPTTCLLAASGTLHLAIAEDDLSEAGPLPPLIPLPNLPPWIQGIVNIGGEIISVIDLPGFLTPDGRGTCTGHRLAVVRHGSVKVGIRLDRIVGRVGSPETIGQALECPVEQPLPLPWFTSGLLVGNQVYSLLNVPNLLTAPRLVDYNRADWPEER